ncbi:NUDIX hydrolase [Ferruginibacter sp. SUN106]|uniref:NUDIX hydrolase n=1 Tax=Ferruginibacter sp. SUN106 TaxID=2978348 RepID=UPI003D36CC6B
MNQNLKSTITLLPCAGLIYIENKKLLLAYSSKKQCFYLPGGKIDGGETAAGALCREVFEEMNVHISETDVQFYTHISAPAYGEAKGIIMEQDCFVLHKKINPTASAEVAVLQYFSVADYSNEIHQAPGAVLVLQQLQKNGLID